MSGQRRSARVQDQLQHQHASAFQNREGAPAGQARRGQRSTTRQEAVTEQLPSGGAAALALAAAAGPAGHRSGRRSADNEEEERHDREEEEDDENDWNFYGRPFQSQGPHQRKRRLSMGSSSSDSSDSSESGSDDSDSSSESSDSGSPARRKRKPQKRSVSPMHAVRAAHKHAQRVRAKLQGAKDGKPVLLRMEALMRFKPPIKGLLRAVKRGSLSRCSKYAQRVAQQLERQAKDLLIAGTFGWDAVGALDSDSGDFTSRELKLIKQQLQFAKHTRQASGGKGNTARQGGGGGHGSASHREAGGQQQQQRYPGFRPNASFPDYRPPRD